MKFRPRLLVVTCTLLVGGALLAGADNIASIDADLAPQMVAEEVESLVRAVADPDATDSHGVLKVSVRCTRADRLGAFRLRSCQVEVPRGVVTSGLIGPPKARFFVLPIGQHGCNESSESSRQSCRQGRRGH